ncbi:reverse transcriptase domain, reverse transcriptase zinc-binding domain protein [Tanacetum coccineum]
MINDPPTSSGSLDSLEGRISGSSQPFSISIVWECIRPRGDEINWCEVVWFSQCIPRHAFHIWLVIKRKLKTQDSLRQRDVSRNTNLNLFQCPLCWNHMKIFAGLSKMSSSLYATIDDMIPMSKRRSARSIIARLVLAASSYFIWQERNFRLFKN